MVYPHQRPKVDWGPRGPHLVLYVRKLNNIFFFRFYVLAGWGLLFCYIRSIIQKNKKKLKSFIGKFFSEGKGGVNFLDFLDREGFSGTQN